MQRLLTYVRPWNRDQIVALAAAAWPKCSEIFETSEHPSVDRQELSTAFYTELNAPNPRTQTQYLSIAEIDDVILRCRLLRAIPKAEALRTVIAMEAAVDNVLEHTQPQAMLSLMVDSYIMHLFALACQRRDIPFIGMVPTFINGYFRITNTGEYNAARDVDDNEIVSQLATLLKTEYKPEFLAQTDAALIRSARRLWLRNIPKSEWFALRGLLERDRQNYHYRASAIVAKNYRSWRLQTYAGARPQSRDDLPENLRSRPQVYLPLQMSPEATIDYWSKDTSWINYEDRVIALMQTHRDTRSFLVKEHPNLLGFRTPGFYRRLESQPNCILIAPQVPSNHVVDLSDAMALCTGSAGFEAALRGVPVYSDSDPYYLQPGQMHPLAALADDIPARQVEAADQAKMMRYLLEGLLPGRFLNNGTWTAANLDHQDLNDTMAQSLRGYFDRVYGIDKMSAQQAGSDSFPASPVERHEKGHT